MELYVLCPTLAVGLLFSLSVLLYSLTKVAGNPFKRPAIQPVKVADSAAVAISASGVFSHAHRCRALGCREGV